MSSISMANLGNFLQQHNQSDIPEGVIASNQTSATPEIVVRATSNITQPAQAPIAKAELDEDEQNIPENKAGEDNIVVEIKEVDLDDSITIVIEDDEIVQSDNNHNDTVVVQFANDDQNSNKDNPVTQPTQNNQEQNQNQTVATAQEVAINKGHRNLITNNLWRILDEHLAVYNPACLCYTNNITPKTTDDLSCPDVLVDYGSESVDEGAEYPILVAHVVAKENHQQLLARYHNSPFLQAVLLLDGHQQKATLYQRKNFISSDWEESQDVDSIEISSFGLTLSLEDVYRRVKFA